MNPIGSPPSVILINFPGNVRDENKAIGMLGKMSKLNQSFPAPKVRNKEDGDVEGENDEVTIASHPNVELRFRPGDVLSQPVRGRTRPTKKLLLKITTDDNPSNPGIQNVSLEGIIEKEVVFEDLCDFQRVEATIFNEKNPNNKVYNLPPVRFSSRTRPTPYNMTTRMRLNKLEETLTRRDGKRKKKGVVHCDFNATNIPSGPDEHTKRVGLDKKLFKYIRSLFNHRPIWLPLNILIMCQKKFPDKRVTHNILKMIIHQFAYRFRNGPFKRVFVKYGIDPRNDPLMAKYQTVDFRPKVDSQGDEPSVFFDRPPNKQIVYFQICDIRISTVIDFVEKELALLNICKKEYGWYKKVDIVENIPRLMKEKLNEWIEEEGFHLKDKDIVYPEDEIFDLLKRKKASEETTMDISEE